MEVRPDRWNETQFLPNNRRVDSAIWMRYMDTNKTAGEKAWRQLLKNATSNTEQVLELYGHLPPITKTFKLRRTKHVGHCWRSWGELISEELLWIPSHGRAKAGWSGKTYIQQLCRDMGCSREDLPASMNDREEWQESVRDICARQDDDDIYIYI